MLKYGKFYIDKKSIIEKLGEDVKEEDIHITSAVYHESGTVDINFVVSVDETLENVEDNVEEYATNSENVRRKRLN